MAMAFDCLQYGPSRGCIEIEKAANDVYFLSKNNQEKLAPMVFQTAETLIERYRPYLSKDLILEANKLCWNIGKTPKEYKSLFLVNVLMMAYRPFNESHRNYFKVLEAIRLYNPEWEKAYVARHERWVQMLQDRKVPIYIGTQ